jgi:hypothetical protein
VIARQTVNQAMVVSGIVVVCERLAIAWLRFRFLNVTLGASAIVVTLGGAVRQSLQDLGILRGHRNHSIRPPERGR